MRLIKFAAVLISICLMVFACTKSENTNSTNTVNSNKAVGSEPVAQPTAASDETASGKKIYTEKCARCHKEDGSGGKTEIAGRTINAENLISEKQKKESDADYIEAIEKGFPDDGMPAFKGKLSDQEIKDVVKYIRTELQK